MHRRMLGGLTACLLALAAASPAIAAEASPTPEDLVQGVTTDSVSPDSVDADGSFVSETSTAVQSFDASDGTLTVTPTDDSEATAVSIGLPIPDDSDVEALDDGSLHFASASAPDDNVFVQQLEDGSVRSITTIPSADAATSFVFPVELAENQQLTSTSDGGVVIAEDVANGDIVEVASAAAPWAVDANGVNLPTWYEVTESSIVQHVDVEGAAFPVLADPTFTRSGVKVTVPGYGGKIASAYLNKGWTSDLRAGNTAVCAIAAALAGLATAGAGTALGIGCAAAAGASSVLSNHGYCLALDLRAIVPRPKVMQRWYKDSWCR
ncbi:MAG: hypothetical protein E7Z95_10355 [Actinomyces succiniciruminis]|nr:hypothetical protein [Actinomyces succiniciruminis]